jgi:DNA polymerase-3 subunit beta
MKSVTVEGRTLAAALKLAVAVIEPRNSIPILSRVLLKRTANALMIEGTDLDMSIIVTLDIIDTQGDDFATCLPAKTLFDIARTAGAAPVRIEAFTEMASKIVPGGGYGMYAVKGEPEPTERVRVDVADGDAVYSFDNPLPEKDWPYIANNSPAWTPLERFTNGRLAELLDSVSMCISTEETRYYLNGVYWHSVQGEGYFVATDGHRLRRAANGPTENAHAVIIPRKTVILASKLATGTDMQVDGVFVKPSLKTAEQTPENWPKFLRFTAGNVTLISKTIDGTFPDYQRVIPSREANTWRIEFDRQNLSASLEKAATWSTKDKGRAVKIYRGEDGKAWLSMTNPDLGSNAVKAFGSWPEPVNSVAPAAALGMNIRYLREFVRSLPGKFHMLFADSGSPILIDTDEAGIDTVLMPMRI